IGLIHLYRLSIYARRSWLAFTFLKASQTSRFEMSNGFALVMRLLPSLVGRLPRQDTAAPSVQPHYRTFSPTADSSVPVSCIGQLILIGATDLNVSLRIKTTGSHVPCKNLSRSHAAFGCRLGWASSLRPSLSRDDHMTSVSTSTMPFRPFIDGLLSLVSPRRTKAGSGPTLSATLTTTALNGSSS